MFFKKFCLRKPTYCYLFFHRNFAGVRAGVSAWICKPPLELLVIREVNSDSIAVYSYLFQMDRENKVLGVSAREKYQQCLSTSYILYI